MSDKVLKSIHEGEIQLGDTKLNVAVLEDGTRIISANAVFKAFGRVQRSNTRMINMPAFLDAKNLQPFIGEDLMPLIKQIEFERLNGKMDRGYCAIILTILCKVYLDARAEVNAETGKSSLSKKQEPLARASEVLLVGLSNIGIIALIDEATGYQYIRERFELQKILSAYISDEILKWQLTFTDDFYKEVYRLWGLPFIPKYIKNKPSFIGKLTTKYIYEQMPKGVLQKIKENTPKTPKGHWKYKFHQSLTPEIGREHLKKQIIEVTTLMSIAQSKEQFQDLFARKYHTRVQLDLEFEEDVQETKLSDFNGKLTRALEYTPKK
jgi:hypothetical protein